MLGIYLFSRCIYIYQIYLSIWIYLFSWGSIWFWSWWWKWWCTLNLQDAPSASRWRSWRVWTWTSLPVPRKAAGFLGMFLVDGDLQKMDIWVTDHQGYPLVNIQKTMVNHHAIQWVNQLFLWPFSIAMLVYQRVSGLVVWWVSWQMMASRQYHLTFVGTGCHQPSCGHFPLNDIHKIHGIDSHFKRLFLY